MNSASNTMIWKQNTGALKVLNPLYLSWYSAFEGLNVIVAHVQAVRIEHPPSLLGVISVEALVRQFVFSGISVLHLDRLRLWLWFWHWQRTFLERWGFLYSFTSNYRCGLTLAYCKGFPELPLPTRSNHTTEIPVFERSQRRGFRI